MAIIMDPHFKDKFFGSAANHQNAKKMLLDECMRVRKNEPCYSTAEPLNFYPKGLQIMELQVNCGVAYQNYCLSLQLCLLLQHLYDSGVTGVELKWFADYLS